MARSIADLRNELEQAKAEISEWEEWSKTAQDEIYFFDLPEGTALCTPSQTRDLEVAALQEKIKKLNRKIKRAENA